MQGCPDPNTIVELLEGGGAPGSREAIEAHIDVCDDCRLCLAAAAHHVSTLSPAIGPLIGGRFEPTRHVAAGGMGTVYHAIDHATGTSVALKLMTEPKDAMPARFTREIKVLAALAHPNVVRYVTHGRTHAGEPFLAMEWVEGTSLKERLREGPLPIDRAIQLGMAICDALIVTHASGVIHRDLKPSNVMLLGGDTRVPKLIDFGLARVSADEDEELTVAGVTVGTPSYMAPEQARDAAHVDARADLFSLGCILYRALTGAHPFEGRGHVGALAKTLLEDPEPIEKRRPDAPPALREAVLRALEKDPVRRHSSAAEVRRELEGALAALPRGPAEHSLATSSEDTVVSPSSFTTRERRIQCVMFVRSAENPAAGLDALAARYGAQVIALRAGPSVITLGETDLPLDQAMQGARLAVAINDSFPSARVALAIGPGSVVDRGVAGEVIDRGAAQLGHASPGTTLVDSMTASVLRGSFELVANAYGAQLLREIEGAAAAGQLHGAGGAMVGRDPELALLVSSALEAFREEEPVILAVTGPSGIGKSRLAEELRLRLEATVSGCVVVRGAGDPRRTHSPYAVISDAVRRFVGANAAPEAAAARLRDLVRSVGGSEELATRVVSMVVASSAATNDGAPNVPRLSFEALQLVVEDLLSAAGARHRIVLLLDDLQWADAASLRLLTASLDNCRSTPLVVVAVARSEARDVHPSMFAESRARDVALRPLRASAARRMAAGLLSEAKADAGNWAFLAERSGGNPFFLLELARTFLETGELEAPDTVLGTIQAHLERWGERTRRVLRAGSVFGATFWETGAAALLVGMPPAEVSSLVDELCRAEVLRVEPESRVHGTREVSFASQIVAEAARASLLPEDLSAAHRSAASWLETVGFPDPLVVASHWDEAGSAESARAWYLRAARRGLLVAEADAVDRAVSRALELGARELERAELLLVRAEMYNFGDQAVVRALAGEALGLASPGSEAFIQALGLAGSAAGGAGDRDEVRAHLERIVSGWPERPSAVAALAALRLALNAWFLGLHGEYDRAMDLVETVPALIERDPGLLARFAWVRGLDALPSQPHAWLGCMLRAAGAFALAGDVRNELNARVSAMYARVQLGDAETARDELENMLSTIGRLGLDYLGAIAKQNLGLALLQLGQFERARTLEFEALALFKSHSERRMIGTTHVYLSAIERSRGDFVSAVDHAETGVRDLLPSSPWLPIALSELSAAHRAAGRSKAAFEAARASALAARRAGPGVQGDVTVLVRLSEALAGVGRTRSAAVVARAAAERVVARAAYVEDDRLRRRYLALHHSTIEHPYG